MPDELKELSSAGLVDVRVNDPPEQSPLPDYIVRTSCGGLDLRAKGFQLVGHQQRRLEEVVEVESEAEPLEAAHDLVIVGLGRRGGEIAVRLAHAGIKRFVLIDDDVLKAEENRSCKRSSSFMDDGENLRGGGRRARRRKCAAARASTRRRSAKGSRHR